MSRRLEKNNRICARCGRVFYRRGTTPPVYCGRFCQSLAYHENPRHRNKSYVPPRGYVEPQVAGDQVGYSAGYVRRLARSKTIHAEQNGIFWYVSVESLRAYSEHRLRAERRDSKQAPQKQPILVDFARPAEQERKKVA